MFRLTRLLRELISPTPLEQRRAPPGPVVIWNLVRRCNLACRHCYSASADKDFSNELSHAEIGAALPGLRAAGVPALILSGGEPLLRPDLFDIAAEAKGHGFHLSLSTNGTLITPPLADRVAAAGFDYVGISIDGLSPVHDRFRGVDGAFAAAVAGIRLCRERGLTVGLRFTVTQDNAHQLDDMLALMKAEGVGKFYLSHLNYAGRANRNRGEDAEYALARRTMERLFAAAFEDIEAGGGHDFVTGNNDADGPFFLQWVAERFPGRVAHMRARLEQWGGNASGVNVANIDNQGWVHPDTMWWHERLGNVRQRAFGDIWNDLSNPLMAALKARPRAVGGRCAACRHLAICNGNSRVRAEKVHGDRWAEDPGCYLTDEEIACA